MSALGNEITAHLDGLVWNFGTDGTLLNNIIEANARDGIRSQAVDSVSALSNYLEHNGGSALKLGGTNGEDFCVGWTVLSNYFNANLGAENIHLQAVQDSFFRNRYSATATQTRQFFVTTGAGQFIRGNEFYVPEANGTYFGNVGEIDLERNWLRRTSDAQMRFQTPRLTVMNEFRVAASGNFGAFGVSAATQAAHIADPTGGSTQDAEARAAIAALIDVLERFGFAGT